METKTISRIKRLDSSVNGNPRFEIGFDDATSAVTSSDHGFCYEIGNDGMREGSTVGVAYTRAGRIEDVSALDLDTAEGQGRR